MIIIVIMMIKMIIYNPITSSYKLLQLIGQGLCVFIIAPIMYVPCCSCDRPKDGKTESSGNEEAVDHRGAPQEGG